MEKQKLIFGDDQSIAYKKKFEEEKLKEKLKENATLVKAYEEEIERDPEYKYSWKCPHCGLKDEEEDENLPYDKIIKCSCGKYIKLIPC